MLRGLLVDEDRDGEAEDAPGIPRVKCPPPPPRPPPGLAAAPVICALNFFSGRRRRHDIQLWFGMIYAETDVSDFALSLDAANDATYCD